MRQWRVLLGPNFKKNWTGVIALGRGFLSTSLVERLFIWGKRITRFPKNTSRFWVNIQCGVPVTKKPQNLRMGKGKGSRQGYRANIHAGSWLLAISVLRHGRLMQLHRHVQVRCAFKVGLRQMQKASVGLCGYTPFWRALSRMQQNFVKEQRLELIDMFKTMHQLVPLQVFRRMYRWRKYVPRAMWVPRRRSRLTLRRLCQRFTPSLNNGPAAIFGRQINNELGRFRRLERRNFCIHWHWGISAQLDLTQLSRQWEQIILEKDIPLTALPAYFACAMRTFFWLLPEQTLVTACSVGTAYLGFIRTWLVLLQLRQHISHLRWLAYAGQSNLIG